MCGSSGGRPPGCLVCPAGITGAWPASTWAGSAAAGAAWWLASQTAAITAVWSYTYAAVVKPSYSTTSRRLPYGLSLVSRISGRPGRAARLPSLPPLRKVGITETY